MVKNIDLLLNKTEDPSVLAVGRGYKNGNTQTESMDKKGQTNKKNRDLLLTLPYPYIYTYPYPHPYAYPYP